MHRRRLSNEFHAQSKSPKSSRERSQEQRRQVIQCLPDLRQKLPEQVSDDIDVEIPSN